MYELVVIGASLGGTQACSTLFAHMNPQFPIPIVLVQHRSRSGENLLAPILGEHSQLPVNEITDKIPLNAPGIYVAPADYHVLIEPGHCAVSVDEPILFARPSINVLFESAADAYGTHLIAILLTGASADGATGVKAIKQAGGIVIVQDPATAECAVMPEAALAAATVDFILPLEAIPAILMHLVATTKD